MHGETITAHKELRDASHRLEASLHKTWQRLEPLLQSVQCMVGYFGQLQG